MLHGADIVVVVVVAVITLRHHHNTKQSVVAGQAPATERMHHSVKNKIEQIVVHMITEAHIQPQTKTSK